MRTVVVTGATGFLGQSLLNELIKKEFFNVVAIGGRDENRTNLLPKHPRLKPLQLKKLFSQDPFREEGCEASAIDTVINCAFPRSNDPALLAQALDFTELLIRRLEELGVKSVINISTQGVYQRSSSCHLYKEDSPIAPIDLYSLTKYATEKIFSISSIPYVTNIRLASLMMPQRFLHHFVEKAKKGEPFTVTAPNQYASLMDVTDAATGLAALAAMHPENRFSLYNLGIGKQYSLLDYAESVKRIGKELGFDVHYDVGSVSTTLSVGMDNTKLISDTGWKPLVMKDEMIRSLFG